MRRFGEEEMRRLGDEERNLGSRYYFSFQKLAFLKRKITRSDGGIEWTCGFSVVLD
jgi:hypothetical protein